MAGVDARRDQLRLAEVRSLLRVVTIGQPSAMQTVGPAACEMLGVERFVSYGIALSGGEACVAEAAWSGFDGCRLFELMNASLRGQSVIGWTGYNPLCPEPRQRNRVLDLEQIESITGLRREALPIAQDAFRPVGLAELHQLRVLICEGASLLRWVGGYQRQPFSIRQRALLRRLIPSLKRRLAFERQLSTAARTNGLVEGLLEALGRPAFIVDARGTVDELNESARALIEREGREVLASLRDSVLARPAARAFDLTEISAPGTPRQYVAVARAETSGVLDAQVFAAAQRFGLSDRHREVLARVVRGETNVTIAANLGIAERTVEVHMTAIMARAGVGNRAELVGRVFGG